MRRRCSFGEIKIEEPSQKTSIVQETKTDGFDVTGSKLMPPNEGSQVVNSKSLLGVNVAVNPTSRFRGKSAADRDAVSLNSFNKLTLRRP